MRRQLLPALTMLLVFTVITGIVYPLAVTGVGQLFFGDQANGALLERDGQVIGSAHIGQQFTAAKYFHPRPSSGRRRLRRCGELGLQPGTDEREAAGGRR